MPTVKDILDKLCETMPLSLCESWDNSGFLVGRADKEVKKMLVALDVTDSVAMEAANGQFDLIVSHHPVIFHPAATVTDESAAGGLLMKLIINDSSVISMHTNADSADNGVNDLLASKLGLVDICSLQGGESGALGRFGQLRAAMPLKAFLEHTKTSLFLKGARFVDAGRQVKQVAVGGGACGDLLPDVKKAGCDTFVTSDIKYSVMLEAAALGVNLIDAGHFETENVICPRFAEIIHSAYPMVTVKITDSNRDIIEYFM